MHRPRIKELLAQGMKPKEIAKTLGCSAQTVYRCRTPANLRTSESQNKLYRRWYRHSERGKWFGWEEFKEWLSTQTHCYITGRLIDYSQRDGWHLDHIVPKSKGGKMTLDNLGVSCGSANCAKWNLSIEELHSLCKEILGHAGYTVLQPNQDKTT